MEDNQMLQLDLFMTYSLMKESGWECWMTKLFGDKPGFKRREDFGDEDDYKAYVRSKIRPRMLVRCNQSRCTWNGYSVNGSYSVKEGHVGLIVQNVNQSGSVQVRWLTLRNGDEAFLLLNQTSSGAFECLDLLTNPLAFNI